jgi:hypothetical protein
MGRKQYKELARNGLYNIAARGLTFTWFTFTLVWFWSNWRQISLLVHSLRPKEIALSWIAIFVGSSGVLALWDETREWLLLRQFHSRPLLQSRYIRTVWGTALVVIATAIVVLLSAPAPDIVYKAF